MNYILLYGEITFCYPFILQLTFWLFPTFGYYKHFIYKCGFEYLFSVFWDIHLGVELLGHMVNVSNLGVTVMLFSTVAAIFHISTNSAQRSNFLTTLPALVIFHCFTLANSEGMKWYFIEVFICMSKKGYSC
jgi:hypothetical protein